nr:IS66 family transposase zinc-finger binding domain-containing protein [Paracoccus isoporae]
MLDEPVTIPDDPEGLRSFTARLLDEVKAQAVLIEKLRHQLAGHRAHRFGTSSESIEQLQLALETSEIAAAAMIARMKLPDIEDKGKPKRKPIPDHIPRMEVELTRGSDTCADCGGHLRRIGEDVTEELGRFIVNRIVRPGFACAFCDRFTHSPLPSRPIERGRPGPRLLAHVLVSKLPGTMAPVGPRKPRRRGSSAALSPEPDIRPGRGRPRPVHAGRLGRQGHGPAGTAGRCHRSPCVGRRRNLCR